MLKNLYLVILLTLVTGFATGAFTYVSTREVKDHSEEKVEEVQTGYEILATVYGGCSRIGCASFRLMSDGEYMYLAPDSEGSYARYEDKISVRQNEYIAELLMSAPLMQISKSKFEGVCPVTFDGIGYRFDIRRETERYSLDMCVQDLDGEDLFIELIKYFDIMEATHRSL